MRKHLSSQEAQLIDILRREANEGFRLEIAIQGGAWEVFMSSPMKKLDGTEKTVEGRGVGPSFDRPWDDVTGLHFDPGTRPPSSE
jgi:hypothetical protein